MNSVCATVPTYSINDERMTTLSTPPQADLAAHQPEENAASAAHAAVGTPTGGKYSRVFVVMFIVAFFANMMAVVTPAAIAISLKLLQIDPENAATSQALVLGVGAIFAAIANPIGGYFSDRSTSRFGRRRPYLALGALIGLAGLLVMAFANSIPLIVVGWAITQTGFNIVFATLYGLLADAFPARTRGRMSGFIGLGQAVGIAGGVALATLFPTELYLTFLAPGVVAIVLIGALALIAPDIRQRREDMAPSSLRGFVTGFWVSPRKYPDYGWAWIGRFLMIFAQTGATGFTVLFLVSRFGFTPENVGTIVLLNTVLGLAVQGVASPLGGWLSDVLKRRKVFVFASAIISLIGILIITVAPDVTIFFVGSLILQLGISAFVAVDLALVTDVLPDGGREAGKHLGVLALANTIPQSLAPAVAPVFLAIGGTGENYSALFIASAVVGLLGAVSVFFIRGVR